MKISLVVPLKNEEDSFANLYSSIKYQTLQPDEVLFVDGGSTDKTTEIIEKAIAKQPKFRLIKTPHASPGKGRNIGVENARCEWIAFTDAGIKLQDNWLERLAETAKNNPNTAVVYGNYAPVIETLFEKCATLAYVPAQTKNGIRGKSIASYIMKKSVWEKVGGFPDLRAAEDLMFMEKAEEAGFNVGYAPGAVVHWQLRPDFFTTFNKFVLYSKHNVWAKRQWDWHYGILKQYLLVLPFIILTLVHSSWWIILIVLWLFARTAKRILPHRFEYGLITLFNPFTFVGVMSLVLVIDLATFLGWGQALIQEKN